MRLRVEVLALLLTLVAAGPIALDDTGLPQECLGDTNFQYSEKKTYVYTYEASNTLHMEGSSQLSSFLRATAEITPISKCEMVLQISDVDVKHATLLHTFSQYMEDLKRHPLPFSWHDGKIKHIYPNPEDSDDVNNIKRGILSALQNSMTSLSYDSFVRETDVTGLCDTEYKVTDSGLDQIVIHKTKNLPSCSNHLKGKSAFTAAFYESPASPFQHLPLMSDQNFTCHQVVKEGIVEEVLCKEKTAFKPASDFGFAVKGTGNIKLQITSKKQANQEKYRKSKTESLMFVYRPKYRQYQESDAVVVLRDLCSKVDGLLHKDVGTVVHELVYLIRGLSSQSIESLYNSLKSKELCSSSKALAIFLDALKAASSEGAVSVLAKLAMNHDISDLETMIWMAFLPFTGYPTEGTVEAALPLLGKDYGSKQALLSVSAMTHKFCLHHPECESSAAVQRVISILKEYLGESCQTSNEITDDEIITALKGFGNLGFLGESKNTLVKCSITSTNSLPIRIAAVEAFRRSPCSEFTTSKLLEIYLNTNDEDELRIAALNTLTKCSSRQVIERIGKAYAVETSKQVEVFTWSYLNNLKTTSDPTKQNLQLAASRLILMKPHSTDITKFSRRFESSWFSERLNLGYGLESNLIHSHKSFIPRSGNIDFTVDIFGYQLNLFELGLRVEDLEHILEKMFGPRGLLPSYWSPDYHGKAHTAGANIDTYRAKIEALREKLNITQKKEPQGTAYIRILGNELRWRKLDAESLFKIGDFNLKEIIKQFAQHRKIDVAHSFLFLDNAILIPSVTGRAYKLASNGSVTVGFKAEGKFDIQQFQLPSLRSDIDGRFQPSATLDLSATMSIHSGHSDPGVKVATTVNVGQDLELKLNLNKGPSLGFKLNFPSEKNEIFSMKREFYEFDHEGERILKKPDSHEFNYCTKYLGNILGLDFCGHLRMPHVFNSAGNPMIPSRGPMEAKLVMTKKDVSMEGYEFTLQLPESYAATRRVYKLGFDTPKSSRNRKYSVELDAVNPNSNSYSGKLNLYCPYYVLEADANYRSTNDAIEMKLEVMGNQKRKYVVLLNVEKDIRGARLAEYKPTLTITLPYTDPVQFFGTVVFAKGRKEQISFNINSNSFGNREVSVKGNVAKEGELGRLDSEWQMTSDFNISALSRNYRIHGTTKKSNLDFETNLGIDYTAEGKNLQSVKLKSSIQNIEFRRSLSFTAETELLMSEYSKFNTKLKWDFGARLFELLKNDVTLHYGSDFQNEEHMIQFTQLNRLTGDYTDFRKFNFENQIGLKIPYLEIDKLVFLTTIWDFGEKPKFFIDVGMKLDTGKYVKVEINFESYHRFAQRPIKMTSGVKIIFLDYEFSYRDELQETSPNVLQGRTVIQTHPSKQITIEYVYTIQSNDQNFHHEVESTIIVPGVLVPIQQKLVFKYSVNNLQFTSHTDTGNQSPYKIDVTWNRIGQSELSLYLPFVDGFLNLKTESTITTFDANFKTTGGDQRRILGSGSVTSGDTKEMIFKISWDADRDPQKTLVLNARAENANEDGVDKYVISSNINYIGSVNVVISGKVSAQFSHGPHEIRADFSGNMEPMSIVSSYELKNGQLTSVFKYLRSNVEKLRADLNGKFIRRSHHFEFEGGLLLTSPYKTFDGKEMYFRLFEDSNEAARTYNAEYRLKPATALGYVGKFDYKRKRGWPGSIKSNTIVTVHQRTAYEASAGLEYGNGRYAFKTTYYPSANRRFNLDTSFEYAARYAAFNHLLATSLQYLQSIRVNAVADLRNIENYKVHSNIDINSYKVYDLNATLSSHNIGDFEGKLLLFGRLTPTVNIFTKAHSGNSLTKYVVTIDKDSTEIISGNGEVRKRKKGFAGEIVFKYKSDAFLTLNLHNEVKSQRERTYVIKIKPFSRFYTVNIHLLKEKKTTKQEVSICKNEKDNCIEVASALKQVEGRTELQLSYKRSNVELNLERIVVQATPNSGRYSTVLYSGERRYGYDFRYEKERESLTTDFTLILPSREIMIKNHLELSFKNYILKMELLSDAKRNPERRLIIDVQMHNINQPIFPGKVDISISHPVLEKPVELNVLTNYVAANHQDRPTAKLSHEVSLDYSTDPEDKIIIKLEAERSVQDTGRSTTLHWDVYHKDDQHLDFKIDVNASMNEDKTAVGVEWKWKDSNDVDQNAYSTVNYHPKNYSLYFVYHRPKLDFQLDVGAMPSQSLFAESSELEFNLTYNGEKTKAKLITDHDEKCRKLNIFGENGDLSRTIEMCSDARNRLMFAVRTMSLEDNLWIFDYSFEVIHKELGVINIRHHWNPEFLGALIFQLTALFDELMEAGIGRLPIADSPQFKASITSLRNKVTKPMKKFVLEEFKTFSSEVETEFAFFKAKANEYYEKLPSIDALLKMLEPLKSALDDFVEEVCKHFKVLLSDIKDQYYKYLSRGKEWIHDLKNRCSNCRLLVQALVDGDGKSFLELVKNLISKLPERFNFLIEGMERLQVWFSKAIGLVRAYLQPLLRYQYVKDGLHYLSKLRKTLKSQYEIYSSQILSLYRSLKHDFLQNEGVKRIIAIFMEEIPKLGRELQTLNTEEALNHLKNYLEEILSHIRFPSSRRLFKMNKLNSEVGILDMDIFIPVDATVIKKILVLMHQRIESLTDLPARYNWKTLLVKLKRVADLKIIPPYSEQAVILGQQHFITFDKAFYDFAGECTYVMASDFEDGNFTVILTPSFSLTTESSGERQPSIGVIINDVSIQVNLIDKSVKANEEIIDLPFLSQDVSVTREGNTIFVDDHYGVHIKCHTVHDVCFITMSGWYYGKTAGLLGTYDYEPANDFKRPRGQVANTVTNFAKSWDISKGCKTKNLAHEENVDKDSSNYKLCSSYFESHASPLSPCFSEVQPEEYFKLCLRHLSSQSASTKALCSVATAYAMECERNYIELNLPSKCIVCEAPDGSEMKHGERKKFESIQQKTSNVIFVVETRTCNSHTMKDLGNIARSIDRELVNDGFSNNLYGILGYDGSSDPSMHTIRGKVFFNVDDIALGTEKIQLDNEPNASLNALEALRLAVTYPFRGGASKSIIMVTCSPCKYDYKSLQYPVVQQILLEHDIILHVISDQMIRVRKAGSHEKHIIGVDADTVYHSKDVSQKNLVGEPALRSQVILPKDACIALAQDVNGSFFTLQSSGKEFKNWRSIFARRVQKTARIAQCQSCDCTSTSDHTANIVCQPCESRKSRLPFSVCKNCAYSRHVDAILSYVFHAVF